MHKTRFAIILCVMKGRIGITTTIPIEIVYAAGYAPVDLNNVLVTSPNRERLIQTAEQAGYPRSTCGWIKGIYGAVLKQEKLDAVIAVTQGDCSNTHALMETLEMQGVRVIPFAYPYDRDRTLLRAQLRLLAEQLGAEWDDVLEWKKRLDRIRSIAHRLDRLTYDNLALTGWQNHLVLVNASDMQGAPESYERWLLSIEGEARAEESSPDIPRIGFIGVPPIFDDLHSTVEGYGSAIVFNETQRQFAMPFDTDDLVKQYLLYTYPYSVFGRIEDIKREIEKRHIDGIVHYVQSFCFRQIEDMIFRKMLDVPILTVEGGDSFKIDEHIRMRVQAFVEMLK